MSARVRLLGIGVASVLAVALGVLAAWPIYRTPWLLVPAAAGLVLGGGIALLGATRFGPLATVGTLLGAFLVTVVPVAVPHSFERLPMGLIRGLLDGVAAVALGWKQLLTLTLPVGTYQSVMVPAYLVFLLTTFLAVSIALRAGRFAPLAAFPLLVPVAFGTIFGSSAVSAPWHLGPVTIAAPRELGLWIAVAALGGVWVWFSAGAARRAALRRGRVPGESSAGSGRLLRTGIGAATVAAALIAGAAFAPALNPGDRQVPRDRIDPEIVLRERPSPLAAYRSWKQDDQFRTPLFTVTSDGALPPRLRLAVLDSYDGVDFHISADETGRFTRFPSGDPVPDPATVTVQVESGYSDIWVPMAGLGSVPSFRGQHAADLADAFYVNRNTGAAIAVPGGLGTTGIVAGDAFSAQMRTTPDAQLTGAPATNSPAIDLDAMPELAAWLQAQDQPATADGLLELIERLRARGYLSHAISDSEGNRAWLEELSRRYGTRFEPSAGGHSRARIEQLFAQLNTQQRLAGEHATEEMLVAGIGDDEQFATAAALIARALGFDSRVVLGVRLDSDEGDVPGVPACTGECAGQHLAAWVEVRGDSGSWAPIDTTPQVEQRPTTLEEGEQLPEFPTTPEERDAKEVDPPLGLGERNESGDQAEDPEQAAWLLPTLRAVGLSAAALVLLALPLLFLPLAKRRRGSTRRRQTDSELKALGAWQEMVDGARDAGVEIPDGASRAEIAEVLGTAPARWAAATASRAVFSAQGVTQQEAEWMWAAVEVDRAEREARMTRWQRIRARYGLGSYGIRLGKRSSRAAESAAGT